MPWLGAWFLRAGGCRASPQAQGKVEEKAHTLPVTSSIAGCPPTRRACSALAIAPFLVLALFAGGN